MDIIRQEAFQAKNRALLASEPGTFVELQYKPFERQESENASTKWRESSETVEWKPSGQRLWKLLPIVTHTRSVEEGRAAQVGSNGVGDLLLEIIGDNAALAANLARWAEGLEQLPDLWR